MTLHQKEKGKVADQHGFVKIDRANEIEPEGGEHGSVCCSGPNDLGTEDGPSEMEYFSAVLGGQR